MLYSEFITASDFDKVKRYAEVRGREREREIFLLPDVCLCVCVCVARVLIRSVWNVVFCVWNSDLVTSDIILISDSGHICGKPLLIPLQ